MSSINIKKIKKELQRRVKEAEQAALKPKFDLDKIFFEKQKEFFTVYKNAEGRKKRFKVAVCSRRCLAKGTLVQTTNGPKPIEDIRPGDMVYNENGAPIEVVQTFENGPKQVHSLTSGGRTLVKATPEHVFLTSHPRVKNTIQMPVSDFYKGVKIVRNEVQRLDGKHVAYAYSLGALLDYGCFSEKTFGLQGVLSWDLHSRMAFIAGLLDSDGLVIETKDGLCLRVCMQSETVIRNLAILFLDLWNVEPSVYVDSRAKYKNGPVYNLSIKSIYHVKRILKDLTPHLKTERKKYQQSYDDRHENNFHPQGMGVRVSAETELVPTYDLHVNSPTNLYMLANGLITHNSGKTIGITNDALNLCLSEPGVRVLYITLTRENCVEIIWPDLMATIEKYEIKCEINQQRLSIKFANGSYFSCAGAKDKREIGKFRGRKLRRIYIDEAQNFPEYIQSMIEEDLVPTLRDMQGEMIVTGTPGPLKRGFFYDISTNGNWESHHWTAYDNPHMHNPPEKDLDKTLAEELEMSGRDASDPKYIRETYGKWTEDFDSLVFKFNPSINVYKEEPKDLTYVFGIDLGFNDADAIAVLGYNLQSGKVYLVEEVVASKQGITELVMQIEALRAKYKPVKMVLDAGGLGKKIQEEILKRHQLPVEAAEKSRKFEFIELMNDDLRTGRFLAKPKSIFEQDCYLVQWDRNVRDPAKLQISKSFHSDICDATLYGWKLCYHFIKNQEAKKPINKHTDAYMDLLEEREAALLDAKKDFDNNVDHDDLVYIFSEG